MKASESNPSMQCSVCGRWMRLHGKDEDGIAIQRFYPCCGEHGEFGHHTPVCDDCCKAKCPYKLKTPTFAGAPHTLLGFKTKRSKSIL